MTHPATTRGLQELARLRSRVAHDFGVGRIAWPDFEYLSTRLVEVEERLVDLTARDPDRLQQEALRDNKVPAQRGPTSDS
jgi:hypothetical protein